MPDRPRRALRLLTPRSRQKASAVTFAPSVSPSPAPGPRDPYLFPWEPTSRAHSLHPPAALPGDTGAAAEHRGCDSLPAEWRPPTRQPPSENKRDRRIGRRFVTSEEDGNQSLHTCSSCNTSAVGEASSPLTDDMWHDSAELAPRPEDPVASSDYSSPPSASDQEPPQPSPGEDDPLGQPEISVALLSELAGLRVAQERQHALLEASLSAAAAQSARLEATLDALRARDARRRPGSAEIVLFGVLDTLAAVLLCVVTWLIAKPCVGVWKVVKRVRGKTYMEQQVRSRRSWRLSGGDVLGNDPFLASAAKRLSFTAAALHD